MAIEDAAANISPDPLPWDQLPNESDAAHRAFLAYRDAGPGRSIARAVRSEVVQAWGKSGATSQWEMWSVAFRWVERARAWDHHLQRVIDEATAKAAAQWAERREAAREAQWETAQSLRRKLDKMLTFPLQRTTSTDKGKTITIEPTRWTFATVVKMARTIAELEAAVLGPAPEEDHAALKGSPEEAAARLAQPEEIEGN